MAILTTECPHSNCRANPVPLNVIRCRQSRDLSSVTCFAFCPKCDQPVSLILEPGKNATAIGEWFMTSPATQNIDLLESSGWIIRSIYPPKSEREAPEHTPTEIARIFKQAQSAHRRDELEAAAFLYGKAIEASIKRLGPELKGSLAKRIDELVAKLALPESASKWAHEVRIVRNDAVHEVSEPSNEDVNEIAEFTEAFLMFVFTMTTKYEKRKSRKESAEARPAD